VNTSSQRGIAIQPFGFWKAGAVADGSKDGHSSHCADTGEGNSVDFPVTPGAYDTALNGAKDDAFVVKISEAAPPPPPPSSSPVP
jgi:hypothetical protein